MKGKGAVVRDFAATLTIEDNFAGGGMLLTSRGGGR
jgi:hypothetical protein